MPFFALGAGARAGFEARGGDFAHSTVSMRKTDIGKGGHFLTVVNTHIPRAAARNQKN